jgi:hypothetical protein
VEPGAKALVRAVGADTWGQRIGGESCEGMMEVFREFLI